MNVKGHYMRREDYEKGKHVMRMEVHGRRKRGRLRKGWMDCV